MVTENYCFLGSVTFPWFLVFLGHCAAVFTLEAAVTSSSPYWLALGKKCLYMSAQSEVLSGLFYGYAHFHISYSLLQGEFLRVYASFQPGKARSSVKSLPLGFPRAVPWNAPASVFSPSPAGLGRFSACVHNSATNACSGSQPRGRKGCSTWSSGFAHRVAGASTAEVSRRAHKLSSWWSLQHSCSPPESSESWLLSAQPLPISQLSPSL